MTILVTGGTGNIGSALARLLQAANYSLIVASPPISGDALEQTKPFFKVAIGRGVKRFVLITATQAEKGDNSQYGKVHEHLANLGVEYTVLRPTWFIVTGKGRIPFVSVQDIAKAAFDALTAEKSANTDYFVIGPELWSYDDVSTRISFLVILPEVTDETTFTQVAAALREITGRKIVHRLISLEEQLASFKLWMDEEYAIELNTYEGRIASGIEEKNVGHPKAIPGKRKSRDYLEANKELWTKA
ncbi:unnamed protein product [Cyclocybe aegerita]|uniref:NAD-dependent epimerase/dehydratase domain-containing protein n=1 Tax=Cyclocybe aegerita TaxID=1973307 RepID=A0A8S0WW98_CYCAE|nr:unnamed protein product [Cyclocybe aegerita]